MLSEVNLGRQNVILSVCRKLRGSTLIEIMPKTSILLFNKFESVPSIGNSRGCITIWQSSKFDGILDFSNEYGLSIKLQSKHTNIDWILTNIYVPCDPEAKPPFLEWFQNVEVPQDCNWAGGG